MANKTSSAEGTMAKPASNNRNVTHEKAWKSFAAFTSAAGGGGDTNRAVGQVAAAGLNVEQSVNDLICCFHYLRKDHSDVNSMFLFQSSTRTLVQHNKTNDSIKSFYVRALIKLYDWQTILLWQSLCYF